MPTVLVIGGAGFIGRALVQRLLHEPTREGLEVRTLDLEPVRIPDCVAFEGCILDPPAIDRAMRGCDAVVHLAAHLGVQRSDTDRVRCLEVNITGTRNVLAACAAHGVRRLVFASSSEVYGEYGTARVSETSAVSPGSVYAVSKLAGEEYVRGYAARHGFEHTILRLFNVFGPGQREEFVVPRFVRAAIDGRSPEVYGTGLQVRAFCSVQDIVQGMVLALFSPRAAGEIFNLGNDAEAITIRELALRVVALARRGGPQPVLVPYARADRPAERDINWRVPEIEKARRVLSYEAKVGLEEELLHVLQATAQAPPVA
jgi:UDP-glucose 4-epimerase